MGSLSTTVLAQDLGFIYNDLPCYLTTVAGTTVDTITGTRSEVTKERRNEIDEMSSSEFTDTDTVAVFTISDFDTVPVVHDTVTVDDVIYFVERTQISPDGVAITFYLRRI